ncbi:hypothetical protein GOODEAATRI_008039 [Goodea atripinnis]|uniref:Uncharacterized protein n=1 Tax=Goodea atripinnis TaxID=208336 RepID=A0ABV0N1Q9_9TELE
MSRLQGHRDSIPAIQQVIRRRLSGPLLLPPLWRRHSCQDQHQRQYGVNGIPLDRLQEIYSQALASHDELRGQGAGLEEKLAQIMQNSLYPRECFIHHVCCQELYETLCYL